MISTAFLFISLNFGQKSGVGKAVKHLSHVEKESEHPSVGTSKVLQTP